MTTVQQWLSDTYTQFKMAGIETARLDSLVLVCDEVNRDKAWVLSHPEHTLQRSEVEDLSTKTAHRLQHVPLAYIRGKVEFYGRDFAVDEHVLVPRPESEAIINLARQVTSHESRIAVIDIGTGSGALAISAALELPSIHCTATDIDSRCLKVARKNAQDLHAVITFLQGDLLQPLRDSKLEIQSSILLANLPYVPDAYPVNQAAMHEPRLALFGGKDGLRLYRKLCMQLSMRRYRPRFIITESLIDQHNELARCMETAGYNLHTSTDLAQCFEHRSPIIN